MVEKDGDRMRRKGWMVDDTQSLLHCLRRLHWSTFFSTKLLLRKESMFLSYFFMLLLKNKSILSHHIRLSRHRKRLVLMRLA